MSLLAEKAPQPADCPAGPTHNDVARLLAHPAARAVGTEDQGLCRALGPVNIPEALSLPAILLPVG